MLQNLREGVEERNVLNHVTLKAPIVCITYGFQFTTGKLMPIV